MLDRISNLKDLSQTRQYGVTLIESILFIIISLGLIIGGAIFFTQARLAVSINDTQRYVTALQSEIRGLYRNSSFGTGPTALNMFLVQSGAVPSKLQSDPNSRLLHAWGDEIVITGDDTQFLIEMSNIPSEACARLTPFNAQGVGPVGTSIRSVLINEQTYTGELTVAGAADACSDTSGLVSITWNFSK